jgi:hypothetical protein
MNAHPLDRDHWVLGLIVLAGHLWGTYLSVFVIGAAPAGR